MSSKKFFALILLLSLFDRQRSLATSWGSWTSCTATCGINGVRTRSRSCPSNVCSTTVEVVPCNRYGCPINGSWAQWTPWSSCCRGQDTTRHRTCSDQAYGGLDCSGDATESRPCDTFCPSKLLM